MAEAAPSTRLVDINVRPRRDAYACLTGRYGAQRAQRHAAPCPTPMCQAFSHLYMMVFCKNFSVRKAMPMLCNNEGKQLPQLV